METEKPGGSNNGSPGLPSKLAVCYPWDSPFAYTQFVDSVLNLQKPEGVEIRFFRGTGWCSARRHTDLCEKALAWGADAILIIGTDQIYPEDLLPRLLARYKETGGDIITALVPFRGYVGWQEMKPFQPLAWRLVGDGTRPFRGVDKDPDMMKCVNMTNGDFQRVNIIGTGAILFRRDHLLAVKRPWFYDQVDRNTLHLMNDMDAKFIWRLQTEAKANMWVDTTIKVKHLHIFQIDETFQNRFMDWKTDRVVNEISSQKPIAKAVREGEGVAVSGQ